MVVQREELISLNESYCDDLAAKISAEKAEIKSRQEWVDSKETELEVLLNLVDRLRGGRGKSKSAKAKRPLGKEVIMSVTHEVLNNRGATDLATLRGLVLVGLKGRKLITSSNGVLRAFTQWLQDDPKVMEVETEKFALAKKQESGGVSTNIGSSLKASVG